MLGRCVVASLLTALGGCGLTDKLGSEWRDNGGQGVHFTGAGLRAHAGLWVDRVAPWLKRQVGSQ